MRAESYGNVSVAAQGWQPHDRDGIPPSPRIYGCSVLLTAASTLATKASSSSSV
jgi:hypothetical protein